MRVFKRSRAIVAMAALWLAAAASSFAATKDEPATPYVHADGTVIRDEQNRPLHLRGVNLGGWLSWEGWIFGGGSPDPPRDPRATGLKSRISARWGRRPTAHSGK